MACHLIALGGTGQKVLEMLSYACACDALYALDDDLRRVPLETLSALTVDTDTTDIPDTAARYQTLQQVFSAAAMPRAGFHTELFHDHFTIVKNDTPALQTIASGRDSLLTQTLFSDESAALDARAGLHGHADIGMFFFADALSRLSERLAQGEAHPFFDRIQAELDAGEDVKVFLAGSVYGGTGMSGIPSVARFLRGRFGSDRLILGAALLLPPHDPRATDENNSRAASALYRYGQTELMRHSAYGPSGLLDAAYLVRISGNLYAANYAQTAQTAQHGVRQEHWLAARSASQFFSTDFRSEDTEALGLYHIPRSSHQPSWPCFDDDRAYFHIRFGGLMRAAALHLSQCHAPILESLSGKGRLPQCAQQYFKAAARRAPEERETLRTLLLEFQQLLVRFVRRMGEVQRVLPPPAPGKAEADCFFKPDALQLLQSLAAKDGNDAEAARKLKDALPQLVSGGANPSFTAKRMIAQLAKGHKPSASTPAAAFAAYAAALLSCTAQSGESLPALQLPPPDSRGFDPNHRLLMLARSLPLSADAPYCDPPDVLAWETRLSAALSLPYQQSVKRPEVIRWRGLMAVLLLWDGWELRHTLPKLRCAPPPEGAGTRAVLAALEKDRLHAGLSLFTLEKDVDGVLFEGPIGLLSPQTALLSAADAHKLYGLLPDCARWYDKETQVFSDPCAFLSETDRTRLIHRLKCLQALTERPELKSPLLQSGALYAAADAFLGDLQNRNDLWLERFEQSDPAAAHELYIRALAVHGPDDPGRREAGGRAVPARFETKPAHVAPAG